MMDETIYQVAAAGFLAGMVLLIYIVVDCVKAEKEAEKLRKIIEELQEELFMMHKMFFDK